jgi:hypothetical protein
LKKQRKPPHNIWFQVSTSSLDWCLLIKIRFGMVTTDNRLESQILFGSEFSKNLTSKKYWKEYSEKTPWLSKKKIHRVL